MVTDWYPNVISIKKFGISIKISLFYSTEHSDVLAILKCCIVFKNILIGISQLNNGIINISNPSGPK